MGFYKQLKEFLAQAKTDNLKTKHYNSEFLGTKVKVSFGQGNAARIPWMSFLIEPNKPMDGIYPVYLYYKDFDLLILAYGVSELNKPSQTWEVDNVETIQEYFNKHFKQNPDRYRTSLIYKVYNLKEGLNENIVNQDVEKIINKYKIISKIASNPTISTITFVPKEIFKKNLNQTSFKIETLNNDLKKSGLVYSKQLVTRFTSSLLTKPFVLLTGLSGSGKTKLAQCFAQWLCESKDQYCIVPVGADWNNREPLLGYVNALNSKEYILPENKALELIIKANIDITKPYFLILDEMNLSHVERYFADFLSVMESNENFKLHSTNENLNNNIYEEFRNSVEVPSELAWPKNLFVIGTVNIDETTYMFSPKVLDRANVIEFRISIDDLTDYFNPNNKPLDLKNLWLENTEVGKGAQFGESFVSTAKIETKNHNLQTLNSELKIFFEQLQKVGAEFGYRTASEIQTSFSKIDLVNPEYSEKENEKIDIVIMQKLLPKLHGSRSKLIEPLRVLASLCYTYDYNEKELKEIFDKAVNADAKVNYPISLEKISRMYDNVRHNGFTSYAEA